MNIRGFSTVLVTIWVMGLVGPMVSHADTMTMETGLAALAAAEKQQNWAEAKRLGAQLEQIATGEQLTALKAHLVKLRSATADLNAAAGYFNVGEVQGAFNLLQTNLDQINKDFTELDNELLKVVLAQRNEYRKEWYKLNKARLDQEYARILRLEEDGRYADAVAKMEALIQNAENQVDFATLSAYKDKLVELGRKKHDQENPGFLATSLNKLSEELTEGAGPFVYLFIVFLAYLLYRLIFKPFHADFLEITLADQSGADNDKAEANKVLSQEFDQCLKRIIGEINEGGELDGLIDLEGAELSSGATRRAEGAQVAEYLQSDPIQIGVLTFSPRSLFDLLRHATRTRGNTVITGALFKESTGEAGNGQASEYVMHIEKRSRKRGLASPTRFFEGHAPTRAEAINQAAMQLVVSESNSKVTRDWRSLEALVRAKGLLEDQIEYSLSTGRAEDEAAAPAGGAARDSILDKLDAAKSLLRKSLAIDPSNWVARYRLANVLRKASDDRTAYWQYSYVVDMLCSDKEKERDNLFEYVKKQPTFPFAVLHKKTICMSRLGGMYLKSNSAEARHTGFGLATTALADLQLLSRHIEELCTADEVKAALTSIMEQIDEVIALYGGGKTGGTRIQPLAHTARQLEKLRDYVYKRLLSEKKGWFSFNVFGGGEQPGQEFNLEKEKIIVNDLIYQINSGITDILADLYEYHSEFHEDPYTGEDDALLHYLQGLESWLFTMRMQLDDRNRNAYACSHAIAHNALGRAYYVKMRNLLLGKDAEEQADAIRAHFDNAETFLRWAIGYHLPASFAEPYINLASLYLKGLEYPRLRDYIPTDWKTRTKGYLQQAIRLSPNHKKAHYLLGRLYQSRIFEDVLLPEDAQAGEKSFAQKALDQYEQAGEDSFSYFRAGQIHAEREEYDKALAKLELCMRIYRRYDEPHQLYLAVVARHIDSKLTTLEKEYNEVQAQAITRLLEDVLKLSENIVLNCFDGKAVVPSPVCSGKLDHEQVTLSIKQLKKLEAKLKDIENRQDAAGKSKAKTGAQADSLR